jgi:fructose-bisphosphate aldolase class 1
VASGHRHRRRHPDPHLHRCQRRGARRFAALSQEAGLVPIEAGLVPIEAGLVPIVEPEVLMDGAHTIERCHDVTADTSARARRF